MRSWLTIVVAVAMFGASTPAQARSTGAKRTQRIDMIVLHSTGGPTCTPDGKPIWIAAGDLDRNLRFIEAHPVLGIHYMIDRDGRLRVSVPEDRLAHHVFHYSERSIAVELVNDGDGRDPYPAAQLDALVDLLRDIVKRRMIGRTGIKRHSDLDRAMLACDQRRRRKVDPGAALPFESVLDRVFAVK